MLDIGKRGMTWQSVGAAVLWYAKKSMRLYSIAIDPAVRGQGLGDYLLQTVLGTASIRGSEKVTLEADALQPKLLAWYGKHGFEITETLSDYYGPQQNAVRMEKWLIQKKNPEEQANHLIVVDQVKRWPLSIHGVSVVSARDYLADERFRSSERFHVVNCCQSYKTHSLGYYVSLIASARNHRILPSVMAIKDVSNLAIAQSMVEEIDDLVQSHLGPLGQDTFTMTLFMGQTTDDSFSELARALFSLFQVPYLKLTWNKNHHWKLKKISALNLHQDHEIPAEIQSHALQGYFQKRRYPRARRKPYKYDLAILVNPNDPTPPSCPIALDHFKKAAEQVGFFVEFIQKQDDRRLGEFDALFIRETTAIDHHTYRMARYAYTEGLVVIDDPWSILHCANKIYLHERLSRGRIRQPASWLLTRPLATPAYLSSLPLPLVLKLPESSFSLGVFCVHDLGSLQETLKTLFNKSDLVIAQAFMKTAFDWRIGVMDHAPLFACKYYMAEGHWQVYNWAQAGSDLLAGDAETLTIPQVPPAILKAAIKAAGLIGDGLYGVDLKEIQGQPYVIEINDNPNIEAGLEDLVAGEELYLRIMTSLVNRIDRERSQARYLQ